jgi:hypothetical protein
MGSIYHSDQGMGRMHGQLEVGVSDTKLSMVGSEIHGQKQGSERNLGCRDLEPT